jgi:hypothetical protein
MLSVPTARVVVVHVAVPPLSATLLQPEMAPPFDVNATVPLGAIGADPLVDVTEAVKVTV